MKRLLALCAVLFLLCFWTNTATSNEFQPGKRVFLDVNSGCEGMFAYHVSGIYSDPGWPFSRNMDFTLNKIEKQTNVYVVKTGRNQLLKINPG